MASAKIIYACQYKTGFKIGSNKILYIRVYQLIYVLNILFFNPNIKREILWHICVQLQYIYISTIFIMDYFSVYIYIKCYTLKEDVLTLDYC